MLLTARPRSLASHKIVTDLRRDGIDYNTIIDGGANIGQFARAAHTAFPNAHVYCFEPLPEVVATLRNNLSDVDRITIYESALGSLNGTIQFQRNSDTQSSSVFEIASDGSDLLGDRVHLNTLDVPIVTLDKVMADNALTHPVLLKLDLQGYELETLKGATETLSKCASVLVETVFLPSYKNEPLFADVQHFLNMNGFTFDRPSNFVRNSNGRIVQMDALFRSVSKATPTFSPASPPPPAPRNER